MILSIGRHSCDGAENPRIVSEWTRPQRDIAKSRRTLRFGSPLEKRRTRTRRDKKSETERGNSTKITRMIHTDPPAPSLFVRATDLQLNIFRHIIFRRLPFHAVFRYSRSHFNP